MSQLDAALSQRQASRGSFSIFQVPSIRQIYPHIKHVKMIEFHQAHPDIDVSYDFDKLIFLELVEHLLQNSMTAFHRKDADELVQNMIYIAYLGLLKHEHQLTVKVYNLLGHTFMVWKRYQDAYEYF